MKQILLSAIAICQTILLSATIHTVSNVSSVLAQYNSINDAINAASNGDTIYVHGSPIPYTTFTLSSKQLVIIGPGWAPDKTVPLTAIVSGANINGTASSGSELQGLEFTSFVSIASGAPITDIRIIRCQFNPTNNFRFLGGANTSFSNFLFEGNWFNNSQIRNDGSGNIFSNFIVRNNLFYENGTALSANFYQLVNTSNFVIDHNLFYGHISSVRDVFSVNCRFLIITNNIFVRRNALTQNSFSTFSNNITYLSTPGNQPWTGNSNIDGGGNIADANPEMAGQSNVNGGVSNPLIDFTIASGIANDAGTDGKDLGLLFDAVGSLNWNTSRTSRLPLVTIVNITTSSVTPGGNIGVTIESKINN